MSPLDVRCPICHARPGERCDGEGGATHSERRYLAGSRQTMRETRPYDVEPQAIPVEHEEPGPPSPNEQRGRVAHALDDATRATGLAGIERCRAILAQHRPRPGGVTGPAVDVQREFVRKAQEAAAKRPVDPHDENSR